MKKQKPIQDSFCFMQKHNHMSKTPHQLTFNFSYMSLTDYGKFTWYLKILLEFLRENMFWNMFFHMLGFFLFKLNLYSKAGPESAEILLKQITGMKMCHPW